MQMLGADQCLHVSLRPGFRKVKYRLMIVIGWHALNSKDQFDHFFRMTGNPDTGTLQCLDLALSRTGSTFDDRPGMTHPFSGW